MNLQYNKIEKYNSYIFLPTANYSNIQTSYLTFTPTNLTFPSIKPEETSKRTIKTKRSKQELKKKKKQNKFQV